MTTKTITTVLGYSLTLSSAYSGLSITTTGGVEPPASAANVVGATGLDIRYGASVNTGGEIVGGGGGADTNGTKDVFGTAAGGGVGFLAIGAFSLVNYGGIQGGTGATGESLLGARADFGGMGGTGLQQGAGQTSNKALIVGGAGGAGGGAYFAGGGGAGGSGVIVGSGGTLTSLDFLTGGQGGQGGQGANGGPAGFGGAGGAGGAAVNDGGVVTNIGSVTGGQGGAGGVDNTGNGGAGGSGGAGVILNGGQFSNEYVVTGGAGGAGGNGSNAGGAGIQGDAVTVTGGGLLNNHGRLSGYDGVAESGAGGLTVVNYGTISGTHDSVLFRNASDNLDVGEYSTLTGPAVGGGGGMTITTGGDTITRLGGAGSLYGAAHASFSGFGRYGVAGGASLTLAGETNTLAAGKTLTVAGSAYLASYLYNGGLVSAVGAAAAASGTIGSIGLTALHLSGVDMDLAGPGAVVGGAGGQGGGNGDGSGGSKGVAGGTGGAGVMQAAGYARSSGALVGGVGGVGGQGFGGYSNPGPGGVGGAGGVGLSLAGTFVNLGALDGGAGGAGAYPIQFPGYPGRSANAGNGGVGGAGAFVYGGALINYGVVHGGQGGAGGVPPRYGSGHGGASGAYGDGVDIGGTGAILIQNETVGSIHGRIGVYASAGTDAEVVNAGLIAGTLYSVEFGSVQDTLQVGSGATFVGQAHGGGGTLELNQGGGTLTGLGAAGTLSGGVSLNFSGFGRYQLDAGAWTLTGGVNSPGTLGLTVGATLTVTNATTLALQGLVSNAGTITLASTSANTDLRVLAGGATLSGAGTISMGGAKAIIIGLTAASTITNIDNTIVGAGVIGANSLTLMNEAAGVIDAVGAAGLAVATKGETLVNQGLMEATGGGILAITNTTVINTGTLLATNLSPVKLQNAVVRGGSIAATGSGVIKFNVSGGELDGTTSAVSLSGVAFIVNGSNETLVGSIANSGNINLIASTSTSDLIIGAAGATLSGGGQVNMTNSLSNRIYGLASGDTLTNVDNRIDGAGLIGNGTMSLVNFGLIVGNQNMALTIDTGANTIVNSGRIDNVGKGGTLVKSAVNNTGTLLAATTGTLNLAGAVTGSGVGQINGGTLYVQKAYAERVTFTGTTGVLELGDSQHFTGTVVGLSKTGSSWLDLVDIGFFAAKTKATFSGTTASGTLTVTDGTHTAHIALQGNYTAATWTVSSDGHGGTKVVDPSAGGLSQAMASLGTGPAPHSVPAAVYSLPRLPILHLQA